MMPDIEIPYSDFELRIALLGLQTKISEEKLKEFSEKISKDIPETSAQKYKIVAEHYGISVLDLINSPNFETLIRKFDASKILEFQQKLMNECDFTEKEAWAIVATASGILKFD